MLKSTRNYSFILLLIAILLQVSLQAQEPVNIPNVAANSGHDYIEVPKKPTEIVFTSCTREFRCGAQMTAWYTAVKQSYLILAEPDYGEVMCGNEEWCPSITIYVSGACSALPAIPNPHNYGCYSLNE